MPSSPTRTRQVLGMDTAVALWVWTWSSCARPRPSHGTGTCMAIRRCVGVGVFIPFCPLTCTQGMLLSDDLPLSEYGIHPYELLELHHTGAYVRLPPTVLPAPKLISPSDAHRPPISLCARPGHGARLPFCVSLESVMMRCTEAMCNEII